MSGFSRFICNRWWAERLYDVVGRDGPTKSTMSFFRSIEDDILAFLVIGAGWVLCIDGGYPTVASAFFCLLSEVLVSLKLDLSLGETERE